MSVGVSAATAAASGGRSLFRPAAVAGLVGFAFDADDGKDQDGACFARTAIDAWGLDAKGLPPRSRIRRKFNDGAHNKTLSDRRTDMIWPAIAHH